MANHATFKASLFMAAGIIDHETGTRDLRRLSGLYRFMPITGTLAIVAAAAMAGVPLLNGFLSKEMFFAETIAYHVDSVLDDALPYVVTVAAMFSSCLLAPLHSRRVLRCLSARAAQKPHEPARWMLMPVGLLVIACLVVGIVPVDTIGPFLDVAVRSVLGPETPSYSLAVWHGLTFPLLMSMAAMVGGALLYAILRNYLLSGIKAPAILRHLSGQRIFDRLLVTLSWRAARTAVTWLGTRRLQPQLRLLICMAVLAALLPLYRHELHTDHARLTALDPAFALLWGIGAVCAIGAARPGEIPSLGGSHTYGRSRIDRLYHLRMVFCTRSRIDAAPCGNRDYRSAPARIAMDAKAPGNAGD